MDVFELYRRPAEAITNPTIQRTRRFSSEHIRKQPEYQFMKLGLSEQLIQTSIDICAYANRVQTSPVPEEKETSAHPGTTARNHGRNIAGAIVPRPTTTGTIKIVQQVDKIYSTITVIKRPKTSVGFCSAPRPEHETKVSVCRKTRTPSGVDRKLSGCDQRKKSTYDPALEKTRTPSGISRKLSGCDQRKKSIYDPALEKSRTPSGVGRKLSGCDQRKKSIYDPALEKSKTYLHKKNDMFTGGNQDLTPARPGLSKLQLHYTDTNATHNDGVIFAHLLQSAHRKNALIGDGVYCLERRLYTKRADSSTWTTFWDRHNVVRPVSKCKPARTVAQKKKERKVKIKAKNDKLKMVFVPRARSLTTPTTEDMEELRHGCRYLRIHPKFQEHLYNTGLVFYGQNHEQVKPEA